jgi:imidazole glycerol-phosphate synthase subunit HisF
MLRKRIVTVLTFNDGVLFRTKLFRPDYRYTANFVDAWSIDEVVILDITRPGKGDRQNFEKVVRNFAENCFVPLCVGGGVRTFADVQVLMELGADKITLNTGAIEHPELITEIAEAYGSQCVVVSIDARKNNAGDYEVFSHFAQTATGMAPGDWAKTAEQRGAGEILITSAERDGGMEGFDTKLCSLVADAVTIPTLILGGAGSWKHFAKGFVDGKASAVCTQNIYHFTDASINSAKKYLKNAGIEVRL